MKITLENYQKYAAEWLDGSLSPEFADAFSRFLADHPMIREELEEIMLPESPVQKQYPSHPDFSALKRSVNEKTVNAGNFLEFVLANMDGELNETSLKNLEEWLHHHPEHQKEARLFELTRLEPDFSIVFKNKEDLFRNVGAYEVALNEDHLEEYIVASLEGELAGEDQDHLDAYMAANPAAMLMYRQFEKTFLTPDHSVFFADKSGLKQRSVVFIIDRRRIVRMFAVAASVAFVAGIFLFDRNPELMITHPGGDVMLSTTEGLLRPEPGVSGKVLETPVAKMEEHSGSRRQAKGPASTAGSKTPTQVISTDPGYTFRSEPRLAQTIRAADHQDGIATPEKRPLAYSVADASGIYPSRSKRTIDEFPIEQIRYFTGGGNERPRLLAQLTFPRIIEVTNPHERINNAGQVILTRWAEWKGKALDEVIPYR